MYRKFLVSEDGLEIEISIHYYAEISDDLDEFTLLISDYNRRTADERLYEDNTSLGVPYVVHNYTKVIKVEGQLGFFVLTFFGYYI